MKKTVDKELMKLDMYADMINDNIKDRDYANLRRLCDVTFPEKLKVVDELVEKVGELFIDEEKSMEEFHNWSGKVKHSMKHAKALFNDGKMEITRVNEERAQITRAKVMAEERKVKEDERNEMREYEERIRQEKLARERESWMEHQRIILETKERELELERQARGAHANLPTLNITPFKGTSKDWIRFSNQFKAQVDSQSVSKTIKLGYLLQCVKGACHELIGNIPNNDYGYDRAMELLREEYGQDKTVLAAHTKEIINLQSVRGTRYLSVKEFYETLLINFEALRAMDGDGKVEGLVLSTLDKLSGIKADLTRNDDNWETWGFDQLLQELRKWLKRHHNEEKIEQGRESKGSSKTFLTSEKRGPHCFYCPNKHWPDQCNVITDTKERKEMLKKRGLCFKCGENHLMKDCKKRGCFICKGNHHSSLHEERSRNEGGNLTGFTPSEECILPLLPFEIRGEEIWGVLDTGSSKNYICRKAIESCNLKPIRWETTRLRTAEGIGKASKRPVYALSTYTQKGERFEFEAVGLDQSNFAETERAPSKDLKLKYEHFRGLHIPESKDGKYEVQMLIGDPTFTEIRTGECKKGLGGQPIADETLFGWAVHGERGEMNLNYFTQTTSSDYEQLYRLDVLGVEDRKEFDQEEVKKEFIENIEQKEDGRYKVKIPWIEDRVPQNTNESQSRLRLNRLMKKMTEEIRDGYEEIIEDQLRMGVIEEVPKQPSGKRIFYMPHKPVVREEATSTKLRMVFDASAKPLPDAFSINECMNPGPITQPLLWDILIRSRMAPVCITGDVTKAFLQVEIDECDRDAFRFLYKNKQGQEKGYRFCRVPFGGKVRLFA